MYQSRCGICCDECERKESVHCTGCIHMELPFWGGQCGVKSCCESKQLHHCGECDEFPCKMCADMGKDMGFDPAPRLQKCKEWRKEKVSSH